MIEFLLSEQTYMVIGLLLNIIEVKILLLKLFQVLL